MAARFNTAERLDQAFARVAAEEAIAVRAALADAPDDAEQAVHRARRGIKRVRALLRLARPQLGKRYRRVNRAWREAALTLAGERDAAVALASFEKIAETCRDELPAQKLAAIRSCLTASTTGANERRASPADAAKSALDAAECLTTPLKWPRSETDLEAGLRRAQQRLRASWRRARRDTDADTLHEWRKRLKDMAAQTGFLRKVLSEEAAQRRAEMQELAEVLGEEHDLAILCRRLDEVTLPPGTKKSSAKLMRAVAERQGELRRAALEKAAGLGAQTPKAFAREIVGRWSRARKDKRKEQRRSERATKSAPALPEQAADAA
jgi:CHAD domain-containing protein